MTVKIGHASLDENGKIKEGKAGDQNGRELVVRTWYNRGWTTVFRAKDPKIAEQIATTMEQACHNDNIGYDQWQRTTLYAHAKKYNFDITKITEKCECDCSSLVAVCINAAGIKVAKDMYTGNQKAILVATGKFEVLTDSKYLIKPDHLKRGDILLGVGHTAVVLSGSSTERAKRFNKAFAGTYKVAASTLNIRRGAGTDKSILATLNKGTEVYCYGYYTKHNNIDWLYIQFINKGALSVGFATSKYLIKSF